MSTSQRSPNITSLAIAQADLVVELDDGRTLTVPYGRFPGLSRATSKQLRSWRLIGAGDGVHWEDLDEDISVRTLLEEARVPAHVAAVPLAERSGPVHQWFRDLIVEILRDRETLVGIASRSRARFERWLQFELADRLQREGSTRVIVQAASGDRRPDLTFFLAGERYDVELKTANTSWQIPGVIRSARPITDNIRGIARDTDRLAASSAKGLMAFILFPVPPSDQRWLMYLDRIASAAGVPISASEHCSTIPVPLGDGLICDVAVCVFPYPPE